MDRKPWYLSKTIWAGIIAVGVAAYNAAVPELANNFNIALPAIPEWIKRVASFPLLRYRDTTKRLFALYA